MNGAATVKRRLPKAAGLLLVAVILFSSGLLLIFVGALGVTGLHAVATSTPSFGIDASSIALTGAPGKNAGFNLTGTSVQGYWASDNGLSLALHNDSGFSQTFRVAPQQADTWGDTISWSCNGGNCPAANGFSVHAEFTVPPSLAGSEGQALSGTLTGDVYSPQQSGDSFTNDQTDVNIPVTVKLVNPAALPRAHGYSLFGISPLIALGGLIAGLLVLRLVTSAARPPKRKLNRAAPKPSAGPTVRISCPDCKFEPLAAALHDPDQGVRANSAEALSKIGDAAVEPLIAALHDPDQYHPVRLQAADVLSNIGGLQARINSMFATPEERWRAEHVPASKEYHALHQ